MYSIADLIWLVLALVMLSIDTRGHVPFPSSPLVLEIKVEEKESLRQRRATSTVVLPSSTTGVSNPQHYEAVHTATFMLCKAIPHHQTGLKKRELEVVRTRMRALRRLEIVWGQDDKEAPTNVSTTSLGAPGNGSSLDSIVMEERAQRSFAKALQDGYLLCQ